MQKSKRKKMLTSLESRRNAPVNAASVQGNAQPRPVLKPQQPPEDNTPQYIPSVEELANSEARYRRLFEASKDGIVILDSKSGLITDVNPYLAKLLGYPRAELVGRAMWDLGLFKDVEASKRAFRELKAKRYNRYEDLPLMTKSGQAVSVEVVSTVYRVRGEKVVQCDIRDIRQRKDAELLDQRVSQAQKMEAVGQLAGGLAHDFNNLLGVILGYCEMLGDQADLSDLARRMVFEIHNAGASAKGLTQSLLAFSRRQVLQPVVMDLNSIVSRMEKMLGRLIGENIRLVSHREGGLGAINADPGQVEQVLMNLTINARDAMPNGGVIVIETANFEVDETAAHHFNGLEPGPYVMLTVSDTGTGMDQETQSHIFEPFFSTKPSGQGTGLGLSTVFGIVRQSGGAISVVSELGAGTSFKICFPRCEQVPDASVSRKARPLRGGRETILLVDDSAALRGLTRRFLEGSGYTVLDSGDPIEALRLAQECPGPLPLMITDVVMPGFSGSVLAEKLATARPETKVLYTSGYNDDSILPFGVPGQSCAFLNKPFTREGLLRKVRDLLDAKMQLPQNPVS